jgi:hypothetical protein
MRKQMKLKMLFKNIAILLVRIQIKTIKDMKKQKLYFGNFDKERAYTLDYIINEMKERGLTECEVSEAIRETKTDYFFCKASQEVCVKPPDGEPCGKGCCDYLPRNGRSGCCRYRGYCYVPGAEFKLSIDGKLTVITDLKYL